MYYDCNPPSKGHWTYRLFVEKRDPETKLPLQRPADYDYFQINPVDNEQNLPAGYLDTLRGLSARLQKRFLRGEFADATPNALFADETIDKWRVIDGKVPDFVRVVVSVDPSDLAMRTTRTTTQSGSWSLRSGRMAMHTCLRIARLRPGPRHGARSRHRHTSGMTRM